jgi:DNA integrity scanning protein DisA with diadenylate cyclase activity
VLDKNRAIIDGAVLVARQTGADVVLLAAALAEETNYLLASLQDGPRVVAISPGPAMSRNTRDMDILALPELRLRRRGRAKVALMEGLAAGLLNPGERVVIISGNPTEGGIELDTVAVIELDAQEDFMGNQLDAPLSTLRQVADPAVFDALLTLCVELGREGKEGKPVGLLLTLGDHEAILERSHQIVINPFAGHPEEERNVLNAPARHAIREFSGVDGAFVLRSDGIIIAGGRYLQDVAGENEVPSGLGARHRAGAGITAGTHGLAFVVSESSGDTRVFGGGRLLMTIERTD